MSIAGGLEYCPVHFPNRHQGLCFLGILGCHCSGPQSRPGSCRLSSRGGPPLWGQGGHWQPLSSTLLINQSSCALVSNPPAYQEALSKHAVNELWLRSTPQWPRESFKWSMLVPGKWSNVSVDEIDKEGVDSWGWLCVCVEYIWSTGPGFAGLWETRGWLLASFFSSHKAPAGHLKLTNSYVQIIAVLHKAFFSGMLTRNLRVLGPPSFKRKILILTWLNGTKLIPLKKIINKKS